MICAHASCQKEITYIEDHGFWVHSASGDEQCTPTFARPHAGTADCVCGHFREWHAFREDELRCFKEGCVCANFEQRGDE